MWFQAAEITVTATTRFSEEDPLCQRHAAVTAAVTAKTVLTVGGGGRGRAGAAARYAACAVKWEKKQTAKLCFSITASFV